MVRSAPRATGAMAPERAGTGRAWVGEAPTPRVGGAIVPERAGPRRVGWRGETARPFFADAEGPHARKRCRVARGGVASAASEHRHPRGKRKALPRSGKRSQAVRPLGRGKPSRSYYEQGDRSKPVGEKLGFTGANVCWVAVGLDTQSGAPVGNNDANET